MPESSTLIGRSDRILVWRGHVFSVLVNSIAVLDTSLCMVLLLYYTFKLYHRVIDTLRNTSAATLEL